MKLVHRMEAAVDFAKLCVYAFFIMGFWMILPNLLWIGVLEECYRNSAVFVPLVAVYLIFYVHSYRWPEEGGAQWALLRKRAFYMAWGAEYFNYRIVKTADLPADHNYIVGSHPHGMLSLAATFAFCSQMAGVDRLYAGLRTWCVTLIGQFRWPLRREFLMAGGVIGCSRRSISHVLNHKNGKGNAVAIVVGGVNEAILATPHHYHLKLKERKGFVRLAIVEGADLVPAYHFGENELYTPVYGIDAQRLRNMQARISNSIGFCMPFMMGQSLLGLPWGGLLPHKVRLETVIGRPLHVKQCDDPTDDEVDRVHAEYCKRLSLLFEEHKAEYGIPAQRQLIFY